VDSERLRGYGLALVAASLWATLGLFYTALESGGFSRMTIVFYRAAVAAVTLFIFLAWKRRDDLRLARRDWPLFLAFGLIGVAAFYAVYIQAIARIGMGVASVLMYTAPAWVTILSAFLFHDPLNGPIILAVALAFGGCVLIGRVYDLGGTQLNLVGLLAGLGSGLAYGLYTLFSKIAQQRYTAWTTLAYGLGLGAAFLLPFQSCDELARAVSTPGVFLGIMAMGLVPTLIGGVAFNAALRRIPASSASIVATLEPVIATLLGWAFMDERLEWPQLLGAGLVLIAVVILQRAAFSGGPRALRRG